ncbi:MAG: YrbL family protein [Pseudomonadota bacterium]
MAGTKNTAVMHLNPADLAGSGWHRECYIHPQDSNRCIKVVVSGSDGENRREQRYYRHLMRRGISWEMLPKFYGTVETNLGEGAIFDLIRDHDGMISRPLEHYLQSERLTERYAEGLIGGLRALREYLFLERIITMTLKPKNILFQRRTRDTHKLILVDNIGNSDLIPLANYSAFFSKQKISRKWRRLEDLIRAEFTHNPAVIGLLDGQMSATCERR